MNDLDLAGIVARDAAWTLDDLTCYAAQDDRRALLALLRETRDAARFVDDGWFVAVGESVRLRYASDLPARLNTLRAALAAIAALDEPTT